MSRIKELLADIAKTLEIVAYHDRKQGSHIPHRRYLDADFSLANAVIGLTKVVKDAVEQFDYRLLVLEQGTPPKENSTLKDLWKRIQDYNIGRMSTAWAHARHSACDPPDFAVFATSDDGYALVRALHERTHTLVPGSKFDVIVVGGLQMLSNQSNRLHVFRCESDDIERLCDWLNENDSIANVSGRQGVAGHTGNDIVNPFSKGTVEGVHDPFETEPALGTVEHAQSINDRIPDSFLNDIDEVRHFAETAYNDVISTVTFGAKYIHVLEELVSRARAGKLTSRIDYNGVAAAALPVLLDTINECQQRGESTKPAHKLVVESALVVQTEYHDDVTLYLTVPSPLGNRVTALSTRFRPGDGDSWCQKHFNVRPQIVKH